MQAYEALRYALDLVNKKDEFLNGQYLTDYYVPGIRMGRWFYVLHLNARR